MSTFNKTKYAFLGPLLLSFIIFSLTSCGSSSTETYEEEVVMPTEGLITVVKEMEPEQFKIEDEISIADTSESLIVAKYLDATIDTFTLAEARLIATSGEKGRRSGVVRAASYGFFGYMMGRRMGGRSMANRTRPPASAYTNPQTADRVNKTAGNKMNQTASRTTRTRTRPSTGKSGYGSGRSTRSFGG